MKGNIYKIYNDINNKIYIGKTTYNLEKRFEEHCRDRLKRKNEHRPLYNAMNKYGINHFHIELIEKCEIELLSSRECYWIEYYNTYSNGYNATKGGDGKQLYDYDLIVELYQKGFLIKEINKLLGCSEDIIIHAIRLAGLKSNTNKIKKLSKKIAAYTLDGVLVKEFDSQSDAARWLIQEGIAKTEVIKNVGTTIGRVANGQRKSAYHLLWKNI